MVQIQEEGLGYIGIRLAILNVGLKIRYLERQRVLTLYNIHLNIS